MLFERALKSRHNCTEPKTKKVGKKKDKKPKMDMLRSIGKQSGESVELVLKITKSINS